jgi:hypothetical protein
MGDAITVESDLVDGLPRPRAFLWKGRRLTVTDLGRQWSDEQGRRHFLVRVSDRQVYELAYQPAEGHWTLERTPAQFRGRGHAV